MRARFVVVLAALGLCALASGMLACQDGLGDERALPALDEPYFRCRVQPVLTKSCAAFACHGDGRRYFVVFARNRLRAQGTEKDRNAPLTATERAANFEAARAFVDETRADTSWLLMKPLDDGGFFHEGARIFGGGNVFANRGDPDFVVLKQWAQGAKEDSSCIEPASDQ